MDPAPAPAPPEPVDDPMDRGMLVLSWRPTGAEAVAGLGVPILRTRIAVLAGKEAGAGEPRDPDARCEDSPLTLKGLPSASSKENVIEASLPCKSSIGTGDEPW